MLAFVSSSEVAMLDLLGHACASEQESSNPGSGAPTEVWRAVVGYEGRYEVSSLGRVRSVDIVVVCAGRWGGEISRRLCGKVLALTVSKGRYRRVTVGLHDGRQSKTKHVCHLVAEAFIGPRPVGAEVAHWDGDPENNSDRNIRYATPSENNLDKRRHGTDNAGCKHPLAKLSVEQAAEIIRRRSGGAKGAVLAKEFGVSPAQISRICSGKRWGHVL